MSRADKAMVEIVGKFVDSLFTSTLEVHSEGGGSLDHLRFRMRKRDPAQSEKPGITMLVDEDDARMLFNWLGAWLHMS